MTKIITPILIAILFFAGNASSQNKTFEQQVKCLAIKIDSITKSERDLLKKDIRTIEKSYNNDNITLEEAEQQKADATTLHANTIKAEVAKVEEELHRLVQQKVDYTVEEKKNNDDEITVTFGNGRKIKINGEVESNSKRKNHRTYPNAVIAFGLNNLMKNDDINSIQDSDFKFGRSHFFELGINVKTRIFKKAAIPYISYGLSVRYNNLRPKNNQFFATNNDNTFLLTHTKDLKKSNFRNVQLVVPVFLEFDFSKPKIKDEKTIFRRSRAFRFGVGGFAGVNLKSKQILKYKSDGKRVKNKTKGDFNVNNFVYGLQGLIGYKETSFYIKYDLQDLFSNSFNKQKNISFGIRFDL